MFVELYDRIALASINIIIEILTQNEHHNALHSVLRNQIMAHYKVKILLLFVTMTTAPLSAGALEPLYALNRIYDMIIG